MPARYRLLILITEGVEFNMPKNLIKPTKNEGSISLSVLTLFPTLFRNNSTFGIKQCPPITSGNIIGLSNLTG
jgi:hypothetical protein